MNRFAGAIVVPLVAFGALLGGCGGDDSGPASADSCAELVDQAADVARSITEQFAGAAADAIDPGTPDEPFPELTRPFAAFRERAEQLGCDAGELRRLACDAYQGITSTGPAVEEMLASLNDVCS